MAEGTRPHIVNRHWSVSVGLVVAFFAATVGAVGGIVAATWSAATELQLMRSDISVIKISFEKLVEGAKVWTTEEDVRGIMRAEIFRMRAEKTFPWLADEAAVMKRIEDLERR